MFAPNKSSEAWESRIITSSVFRLFSWELCYLYSLWCPSCLLAGEDLEEKFSCRPLRMYTEEVCLRVDYLLSR